MQNQAADQLHVEVTHAGSALAGFTNDGERFGQNLIQCFPLAVLAIIFVTRVFDGILNSRLEKSRALAKLIVRKLLNLRLEGIDLFDRRANRFQESLVAAAENFS